MLHDACCMLYVACCMLLVGICVLLLPTGMLHVACCMLLVGICVLLLPTGMLHVACCMLHVCSCRAFRSAASRSTLRESVRIGAVPIYIRHCLLPIRSRPLRSVHQAAAAFVCCHRVLCTACACMCQWCNWLRGRCCSGSFALRCACCSGQCVAVWRPRHGHPAPPIRL